MPVGSSHPEFSKQVRRGAVAKSIIVIVFLILVSVALLALFVRKPDEKKLSLESAITYTIFQGDFRSSIVESGDLESSQSVEIRCQVKSKGRGGPAILTIVPEGTMVKKGEFLAQLDDSVLKDELTQQKITVATDKAAVIQAENDLSTAKSIRDEYKNGLYQQELAQIESEKALAEETLRRSQQYFSFSTRLAQKGLISKTQLEAEKFAVDKAIKDLEIATEKLSVFKKYTYQRMLAEMDAEVKKQTANQEAAQFTLELSKQRLKEFETQVAACKIVAPNDGMVVYANEMDRRGNSTVIIEEGAILRDGQEIFRLPDPTQMQVLTTVNDSKINDVHEGQRAIIRLDTDPDAEFEGRVAKVASFPLPRRWYQAPIEYEVWVEITAPNEQTRPGLRGKVEIIVNETSNVVQAPISALVKRDEQYYVLVKNGNDLKAQAVEIGYNNDQFVIIESGVSVGDEVLVDPDKFVEFTELHSESNP